MPRRPRRKSPSLPRCPPPEDPEDDLLKPCLLRICLPWFPLLCDPIPVAFGRYILHRFFREISSQLLPSARNTGTCLYMVWTGLACLNQFINSIVWNNNAINWAPVWCDISSRFIVGTAVAIPATSLCINRRLYIMVSMKSVTVTKAEKRRQVMVDLAIGLGLPIMEMILRTSRCYFPFPFLLTSH